MALWNDKTSYQVNRLINDKWGNPSEGNVLEELQKELFKLGIVGNRIPKNIKKLVNSVTFSQETIDLENKSFTNSYDLSFDTRDNLTLSSVESRPRLFPLYELFDKPNIIGAVNAGFFCLVDEYCQYPQEATYDMCIRNNKIYGLPFADRPALLEENYKLKVKDLKAIGIISINGKDFTWKGVASHSEEETDFILFNSSCCTVKHKENTKTGTIRVLEESSIYISKDPNIVDVLVKHDDNSLKIKSIHKGGNTNLFDGNFVLRFSKNNNFDFVSGMSVIPKSIDGVDLSLIHSGITIGPSVYHFLDHNDHDINYDKCHGSKKPTYSERRSAMSIIYEDLTGRVHMRIFDGIPSIKQFSGVTAKEVAQIIPKNRTRWAYLLDPGQSSKIVIRESLKDIVAYGNTHYIALDKNHEGHNNWAPLEGRAIGSAITLICK